MCLLLALLLCMGVATVNAAEEHPLSEMSDEDCIAFVSEHGIAIPQWYDTDLEWAPFIRMVISMVEKDPNVSFGFGHTDLLMFAEGIKVAVIESGAISKGTRASGSSTTNILEDNWVVGSWSNSYENYNCYAYAIGQTIMIDPGYYSNNSCDGITNPNTIATYIKADLEALGYTGVYISSALHTSSGHEKAICVRTGIWYNEHGRYDVKDYHVMRCETDGYWYHKPGWTNPLKFKYAPNYKTWYYEAFDGTTYKRDESAKYTSAIWYVMYTTQCHYEYTYQSDGKHIQKCTTCGQTQGNLQSCVYVNNICRLCGHYGGFTPIEPKTRLMALKIEATKW